MRNPLVSSEVERLTASAEQACLDFARPERNAA